MGAYGIFPISIFLCLVAIYLKEDKPYIFYADAKWPKNKTTFLWDKKGRDLKDKRGRENVEVKGISQCQVREKWRWEVKGYVNLLLTGF